MKTFEYPQMIILTRSTREAAYGPENPYHCTFNSCCYQGKWSKRQTPEYKGFYAQEFILSRGVKTL